jgi:rhodanese-related sulfurtransferase/CBS domain-containing protein
MTRTVDLEGLDALLAEGATVVDVLPKAHFDDAHIPGARSIPLTQMDDAAVEQLDRSSPIVVYCFDYQCDLSPRAAARLEDMGFADVRDFSAGLAAWTSDGRPTTGAIGDHDRIAPHVRRDVPRCGPDATIADVRAAIGEWELCAVVNDEEVLLGIVRADATSMPSDLAVRDVLVPGPGTVRPDARVPDMADQLDGDHLDHVLVSTYDGRLVGLLRRADLDAGR